MHDEDIHVQSDHDLLIRVDTKLTILLAQKGDHEIRIRRLEFWGAIAIGVLYAFEFYFKIMSYFPTK